MTGRLFAVCVGAASILALAFGAIVPGCYTPPEPVCGFVCGGHGECPNDYTCLTADNRCHLNGSPMMACGSIDAGPIDGPRDTFLADAAIDAELIDAEIDAPVDAMADGAIDAMTDAGIDAMVDAGPDAMVDAAPMIDAMVDAVVDALPDAATDAPMVDSAPMDDAAPDAGVPLD